MAYQNDDFLENAKKNSEDGSPNISRQIKFHDQDEDEDGNDMSEKLQDYRGGLKTPMAQQMFDQSTGKAAYTE